MAEKKTLGSAKRYGTRYGATLKRKVAVIEAVQRSEQKCPYCNKLAARWMSIGIYECTKCNAKFTAKAYGIHKKITFAEAAVDDTVVEEEDDIAETEAA
jgi:large subunit ribosomal protein L37Ae